MVKVGPSFGDTVGGGVLVMGKKQVDEKMPGTVLRQPKKQKAQSLSRGGFHLIRKETDRPLGSQLSGQTQREYNTDILQIAMNLTWCMKMKAHVAEEHTKGGSVKGWEKQSGPRERTCILLLIQNESLSEL